MTTRFLQFTLLISLLIVFSANTHAQKLLTKGDLKPVIDNVFIWHATHSAADIDRGGSAAMGTGTFNNSSISGSEGMTNNGAEEETNDATDDIVINNHDVTETNGDNSENSTSIGIGGLLSDNPVPSRGGNEESHTNDSDTEVGDGNTDSTENTTNPIEVGGIDGKWDSILEQIVSYPNPASDRINVLVPMTDEMVRIRLISLAGQSVVNQRVHGNTRVVLETYHLPEGVYLLEFTSSDKQIYRRTYIKR